MEKLVTVIVPVFNGMTFLDRFIENIDKIADVEIVRFIFVDNGSTDGTQKYVKENFQYEFEFIQNPTNFGISGSINIGQEKVQTPYSIYLPVDDWLHPLFLKEAVEGLENNKNCSIAFGQSSMHVFGEDGVINHGFRFCPYMESGTWDGDPFRTFAIDYPTDVAIARHSHLIKAGGFTGGHWQSQIQFYGDIFFTGGQCLQSGKQKNNNSSEWASKGIQNQYLVKFFYVMHNEYCRSEAERAVLRIIFSSLTSGMTLLDTCKHLSQSGDMHMRSSFIKNQQEIFEMLQTVLWGNFRVINSTTLEGPINNRRAKLASKEDVQFIRHILKHPNKFLRKNNT